MFRLEPRLVVSTEERVICNGFVFIFNLDRIARGMLMLMALRSRGGYLLLVALSISVALPLFSQSAPQPKFPWMNTSLSPDERAALVVKEMTLDEKITLLHGTGHPGL